ncbi:MAG: aldehyde ferredoxin oxidoreductase family protein [Promethearchaeota archaeon]
MKEKWYGYVGKILRVNLTDGKVVEESLSKNVAKKFLGCVGYAAKILWDELERGDPLSPENKLIIATGPLTGTLEPGSGSWEACFKSPLTNGWGEARCGGFLGPELKFAGFDMIIIEGRAKNPSYIWINDGEVKIRSAEHLWGKTTVDTEKELKEELGDSEVKVATIGPAGESLVRFACIVADTDRVAGRGGPGAVMGSKNLKAVAVRGSGKILISDPESYLDVIRECETAVSKSDWLPAYLHGTISFISGADMAGDLPTKYGASNNWGKGDDIYVSFENNYLIKSRACYGCAVACARLSGVKTAKWFTPPHGGPEYETVATFTAFMLHENLEAVIHANYLCNLLGMDTISCGNAIAFAMECYDKGLITKNDTDDTELNWGNSDSIVTMVKKIGRRDGFGDLLAEGVRRAAKKIGKGAPELALHVKGLELPMHDPRAGKSLALQYGTANRGMCHIHPCESVDVEAYGADFGLIPYGLPKPPVEKYGEKGKAVIVKLLQDYGVLYDIMGVCKFLAYTGMTLDKYAKLLAVTTGYELSEVELLNVGERVINLQRCFNVREGLRRKDDMIPKRIQEVPHFGAYANVKETAIRNYNAMLDEYYKLRGWNRENGVPTQEKLKELGLEDVYSQISRLD